MCETVDIELNSSPNYRNTLEHLINVSEETNFFENELRLAQKSFTDCFFESTASINSLRMKLSEITKGTLNLNKGRSDHLEDHLATLNNKTETLNKTDNIEDRIERIQSELHNSTSRSSLSIKRSLMKLSNLLAQHDLLNLPYYELKAYSNQIIEQRRRTISEHGKPISEKLSYYDALESLDTILEDVEKVEDKTLYFIKRYNDLDYSLIDDPYNLIKDEYKNLPQLSASMCHKVNDAEITNKAGN